MTAVFVGNVGDQANVMPIVPTSGQTISIPEQPTDVAIWLEPATDLATLTINMPSIPKGNSAYIGCSKNVLALTLVATGGSIFNTLVALTGGDLVGFMHFGAQVWARHAV